MINLPNVTLVAITSIEIEKTIKALQYSCRGINFGEVKLITDANVSPNGITIVKCPRLNSKDEYSKFLVYNLHKHIDTDFSINISYSGFIVNPEKWTDEFLNYDYVGALWPVGHNFRDKFGRLIRVGNGIALRSKKLLLLAYDLDLPWEDFNGCYHEDVWISVKNRHIYEENGCKWASVEVAAKFSREKHNPPIPENEGIEPFLFHGKKDEYLGLI